MSRWLLTANMLLALSLQTDQSNAWQISTTRMSTAVTTTKARSRRDFAVDISQTIVATVSGVGSCSQKAGALESTAGTASKKSSLTHRLDDDILQQQQPTVVPDEFRGIDNFFYPDYMAGTWDVTQTLVQTLTPLGPVYLGGPNGDLAIAEKTIAESRSRLNIPVQLQLRYVPTKWGVAEDRLFNTRKRLNAFAGRSVVASTDYADVGACNRQKVLAMGGTEEDPLQTTFVRFKGPAAQKTFLTAHRAEADSDTIWVGSESLRSIFALTNENTAPPIFTDCELIWQLFTPTIDDQNHVQARLRIASYLNAQQDKLYFQAKNRAVSILDYTLDMRRQTTQQSLQ